MQIVCTRRTGHPVLNISALFVSLCFRSVSLFPDCECKGRPFFETTKLFAEKNSNYF